MTDELKAEEAKVKTILTSLNADTVKASSWVNAHVTWMIGLGAFVLGAIVGHFLHFAK